MIYLFVKISNGLNIENQVITYKINHIVSNYQNHPKNINYTTQEAKKSLILLQKQT